MLTTGAAASYDAPQPSEEANVRRSVILSVVGLAVTCLAGCAGVAVPADGPSSVSTPSGPSISAVPRLERLPSPLTGEWHGTSIQGNVPTDVSAAQIRIDFDPLVAPTDTYPQVRSFYQGCPAVWSTSFRLDAGRLSLGTPVPVPAIGCAPVGAGPGWLHDFLGGPLQADPRDNELVLRGAGDVSLTLRRG